MIKKKLIMLTKLTIYFICFFIIIFFNKKLYAFQNPTFKDDSVIFYYIDRPRHYSERADNVKIYIVNEATNYEKTLDLTRESPNLWSIKIPISYLYLNPEITNYTYYYYFIVDGKKILDPTNKTRTMPFINGIDGRISYFRIEHKKRNPVVITKNPDIISNGLIFYYTKETFENDIIKLIISKENTNFSRVYPFRKNEDGIFVAFVDINDIPDKTLTGRYYYKFIVNNKYVLDTLNPNQVKNKLGGIFNLVEIKDSFSDQPVLTQNPILKEEGLFFYVYAPNAKKVGLLTDINRWQEILPMTPSPNPRFKGYWVIIISKKNKEIPLTAGTYKYKFIIDGIYSYDINNPNYIEDGLGGKLSVFTLETNLTHFEKNPIHIQDNIYRFFYKSRTAKYVFLVGTFNNWNPFSHKMKKINDELFIIDIRLHPGTYYYMFSVNNKLIKDPTNTDVAYNDIGDRVSVAKLIPPAKKIR